MEVTERLSTEIYLIGSINFRIEANLLTCFGHAKAPGLSKINTYFQKIPSCNGYLQKTEDGKREKGETEKNKSHSIWYVTMNRHWPPVSSLTTIRSTPSATSFFKVEESTNWKSNIEREISGSSKSRFFIFFSLSFGLKRKCKGTNVHNQIPSFMHNSMNLQTWTKNCCNEISNFNFI